MLVLTPNFPVGRLLLRLNRIMPMLTTPRRHCFQTAPEPLPHCPDMNREFSLPASLRYVRESEKIESRRFRLTRFLGYGQGCSPKPHQPSLVRMQRQSVLLKSLPQHIEHFLGVLPILKAENEVVGKTDLVGFASQPWLHYRRKPLIEHVVKIDVGEQGADHLPLSRPRFADKQSAFFDHSDVNPFPNQPQDCSITDPFLEHLHEQASDDCVEVSGNIRFQNCRNRPPTKDSAHLVQRVLW